MEKLTGWDLYKSMGSPKYICAPMVDQSELPWRMLCRKYGTTLCYTPMLHSKIWCCDENYRLEKFSTCETDRPLIAQFCGNDTDLLIRAAEILLKDSVVDAIDLNLGCPQRIAKSGFYGSYLMDNLPLVKTLVEEMHKNISVPITVKIRCFPKLEDTLAYAKMLEGAGCQILTIHGRTREQRGHNKGLADWDAIKAVKQALSIPVFANGNIRDFDDVEACLKYTGCDAIMSAEGLLEYPALFSGEKGICKMKLSLDYLEFCEKHPTEIGMVRHHIFHMIGPLLNIHTDLRVIVATTNKLEVYVKTVLELKRRIEYNLAPPEDKDLIEKQEQRKKKKQVMIEKQKEAEQIQENK